jgi:hypothetical protein
LRAGGAAPVLGSFGGGQRLQQQGGAVALG